jgi:hypothetical protein
VDRSCATSLLGQECLIFISSESVFAVCQSGSPEPGAPLKKTARTSHFPGTALAAAAVVQWVQRAKGMQAGHGIVAPRRATGVRSRCRALRAPSILCDPSAARNSRARPEPPALPGRRSEKLTRHFAGYESPSFTSAYGLRFSRIPRCPESLAVQLRNLCQLQHLFLSPRCGGRY